MLRSFLALLSIVFLMPTATWSQTAFGPDASVTYELMINGESFQVESNKMLTLKSRTQPGVEYDVALRVAPTQRLKLGSVRFDYDWLSEVKIEADRDQPTARLEHELGFAMIITALGPAVAAEDLDKILKLVAGSVVETFREQQARQLEMASPHTPNLEGVDGRGVVIRHVDNQDVKHTCLVYVLTGPSFTVSCVVQYLDTDFEEARDVISTTLNSFGPAG